MAAVADVGVGQTCFFVEKTRVGRCENADIIPDVIFGGYSRNMRREARSGTLQSS